MKWDFFISHASQDKEAIALPLSEELTRAGYRVWLDTLRMRVGTTLAAAIDAGMAESHFGIVILSRAYFESKWAMSELRTLSLDPESILPIWHDVDEAFVWQRAPNLAVRLATETKHGLPAVTFAIISASSAILDAAETGTSGKLRNLLKGNPASGSVAQFLAYHPQTVMSALGMAGRVNANLVLRPQSSVHVDVPPDFFASVFQPTIGVNDFAFLWLGPIAKADVMDGVSVKPQVVSLTTSCNRLLGEVTDVHGPSSTFSAPHAKGVVVVGRRDDFSTDERSLLQQRCMKHTRIRTYDWLLEAQVQAVDALPSVAVASDEEVNPGFPFRMRF